MIMTKPRLVVADDSGRRRRWFGQKVRPLLPPEVPFPHEEKCRTPDATPEWVHEGDGRFTRTCSCQTQYTTSVEPVPVDLPDVAKHRHDVDEDGRACTATARVSNDSAGVTTTYCAACGTRQYLVDVSDAEPEYLDALSANYAVPGRGTR